jgi:indole-3-glycerol phosphate synthase
LSAHPGTVLAGILEQTRAAVARRKREHPLADPPPRARAGRAGAFASALSAPGISVIAEFKRRSPSAGSLHRAPDLERIVAAYARGGAAALSVLTEEQNFGGSLADLRAARAACELPLLRKDFVVDDYQLAESVLAGADAVLLIVAALAPSELAELHAHARALGLDVLVEVHDERELEVALDAGARIVGVNNRDLRDFSVDIGRTERLLGAIPDGVLVVSESGIARAEQLVALHARGVHAVLVGETLMRAEDPAAALVALRRSHDPGDGAV